MIVALSIFITALISYATDSTRCNKDFFAELLHLIHHFICAVLYLFPLLNRPHLQLYLVTVIFIGQALNNTSCLIDTVYNSICGRAGRINDLVTRILKYFSLTRQQILFVYAVIMLLQFYVYYN